MKFLNYIKGVRKGKDARRIELDAMYDPFLDESIEGYDLVKGEHLAAISNMQKEITKRSRSKNKDYKVWLSVLVAASLVGVICYFTLFDRAIQPVYGRTDLCVYLPSDYIERYNRTRLASEPSPLVVIENVNILHSTEGIDIYIPQEYVDRRKADGTKKSVQSATVIINVNEIFEPEVPLDIYVPKEYIEQKRKKMDRILKI